MTVIKFLGGAVVMAVCLVIIRNLRPELAPAAAAVGGCMLTAALMPAVSEIFSSVKLFSEKTGTGGIFGIMLKAVSAALACEICGGVCRDMGENGVAARAELVGRLYIILLSLPLVDELLNLSWEFLK